MVPFLRDPMSSVSRRRTRKGIEIVRHILPYWFPVDRSERELNAMVRAWIEPDDE